MLCCAAHGRHAALARQACRRAGVSGSQCGRHSGSGYQAGGFRGSMAICLYLQGTEDLLRENPLRVALVLRAMVSSSIYCRFWHAPTGCGCTANKSGSIQSWRNV